MYIINYFLNTTWIVIELGLVIITFMVGGYIVFLQSNEGFSYDLHLSMSLSFSICKQNTS